MIFVSSKRNVWFVPVGTSPVPVTADGEKAGPAGWALCVDVEDSGTTGDAKKEEMVRPGSAGRKSASSGAEVGLNTELVLVVGGERKFCELPDGSVKLGATGGAREVIDGSAGA